jgi:hypothetical protein
MAVVSVYDYYFRSIEIGFLELLLGNAFKTLFLWVVFTSLMAILVLPMIILKKVRRSIKKIYISLLFILVFLSPDIVDELSKGHSGFSFQFGDCQAIVDGVRTSCGRALHVKGLIYRVFLAILGAWFFLRCQRRHRGAV